MARMMPPLRLPCCQPGARASWRTGSGNLRPVLSADAVFIAHLCQSLHCCGAPHEATAEGWARSGPHPWWLPWHTVYDARPLHEHVRWDHHASHRRAPEHIGVYPVPITMPTSGPSPSPHRPRGSVPAWIRRCGRGRDEPRRREVRAETLDLVPLRRRAPSYRHRLELGRDWAEPRRRGPARRLGASHAAVAAGVPRRSLALALLLDTVASVPLNLLNRGAKMRKCLRSQKLKTTFPADDRFPTDSGPVCWTCHQRQEATPDEVRVFRLWRRRATSLTR